MLIKDLNFVSRIKLNTTEIIYIIITIQDIWSFKILFYLMESRIHLWCGNQSMMCKPELNPQFET